MYLGIRHVAVQNNIHNITMRLLAALILLLHLTIGFANASGKTPEKKDSGSSSSTTFRQVSSTTTAFSNSATPTLVPGATSSDGAVSTAISFSLPLSKSSSASTSSSTATSSTVTAAPLPSSWPACPNDFRVRRSFASMSPADRKAFTDGFLLMKQRGIVDMLVQKHRTAMWLHGTSNFLPFHRAMIHEFEENLRQVTGGAVPSMPYWDELADSFNIPASKVFSDTGIGALVAGPLGPPLTGLLDDSGNPVVRSPLGQAISGFGWIIPGQVLADMMPKFTSWGQMSTVIETNPHNQYHLVVGGHMAQVPNSPCDVAFWLHHTFIDLLWAGFQAALPGNAELLTTTSTQDPQLPNSLVFGYNYTNTDVLRYRTRLCYTYEAVADPNPAVMRRASSDADPSQQLLPRLAPIPDEQWAAQLQHVNLTQVRAAEAEINAVIDALNRKIASGAVEASTLPVVDDYVAKIATVPAKDDGAFSAIPVVQKHYAETQKSENASTVGAGKAVMGAVGGVLGAAVAWFW
ncbi:hypothetical protein BC828DRAFT_382457 [Blastocladiella britannica]|nr:hypothetical protein BC828DRAFT_382457 [Blastocladiella britannica]